MNETARQIEIRRLTPDLRSWAVRVLTEHWGSVQIVSRGRIHQADALPGYAALENHETVGLLTYALNNDSCEIVTLNSLREGIGVGTGLLLAVISAARESGCHRVWLITTNDNLPALRFYQRRGFHFAAVYPGALDESRRLKPEIPAMGINGIPLRDEIELELQLGE